MRKQGHRYRHHQVCKALQSKTTEHQGASTKPFNHPKAHSRRDHVRSCVAACQNPGHELRLADIGGKDSGKIIIECIDSAELLFTVRIYFFLLGVTQLTCINCPPHPSSSRFKCPERSLLVMTSRKEICDSLSVRIAPRMEASSFWTVESSEDSPFPRYRRNESVPSSSLSCMRSQRGLSGMKGNMETITKQGTIY
jgi:hypothetical protein